MGGYKYSAIIDCEVLGKVQTFYSNDFIAFEENMKLLEELLSQLKITYTVYFNIVFWDEYLDRMKYEKK